MNKKIENFIRSDSKIEYKIMDCVAKINRVIGIGFYKVSVFLPLILALASLYIFYYNQIGQYRQSWNILSPFNDMLFRKSYAISMKVIIVIIMLTILVIGSKVSSFISWLLAQLYLVNCHHRDNAYDRMSELQYQKNKKAFMQRYKEHVETSNDCTPIEYAVEEFKYYNSLN